MIVSSNLCNSFLLSIALLYHIARSSGVGDYMDNSKVSDHLLWRCRETVTGLPLTARVIR